MDQNQDYFSLLPREMIAKIAKELPINDVRNLMRTNHRALAAIQLYNLHKESFHTIQFFKTDPHLMVLYKRYAGNLKTPRRVDAAFSTEEEAIEACFKTVSKLDEFILNGITITNDMIPVLASAQSKFVSLEINKCQLDMDQRQIECLYNKFQNIDILHCTGNNNYIAERQFITSGCKVYLLNSAVPFQIE